VATEGREAMIDAKFTPGPWIQSHRKLNNGNYSTQVYTKDGETICTLDWYPKDKGFDEKRRRVTGTYRKENAELISASPEMYEALKIFIDASQSSDPQEWSDAIEQAESAIAKAEGRS
jgi:hypothetical protein